MKKTAWHMHLRQQRLAVPEGLFPWLNDRGSMTKHLRQQSQGHLQVQIIEQTWGGLSFSEAKFLDISQRSRVFIREIYLCCLDEPWIYAKTVIPYHTLEKQYVDLYPALKGQPLGDVLFSRAHITRGKLEWALLTPSHNEYSIQRFQTEDSVWARRSLFWLKDNPISIFEVFLPSFCEALG